MDVRQLGNSDLFVSSICLGCMEFGTRIDQSTAFALLDCYFDQGGRFFDTANNYAFWEPDAYGGESETVIGEWLRSRSRRSNVIVASKCGAMPIASGGEGITFEGLSRSAIISAVEQSLRRLQIETIGLYYAHIDDLKTPLEETLSTLDVLRRQGKIREIGCSNYNLSRLKAARAASVQTNTTLYCCLQQRHSYLKPKHDAQFGIQEQVTDEMSGFLKNQKDITLVAYGVLRAGILTDNGFAQEYDTPENIVRISLLKHLAQKYGATAQQIALAWIMRAAPFAIPLVSSRDVVRLQNNLSASALVLEDEDLAHLSAMRMQ